MASFENIKKIHFVGVGGTGTGSLAVALANAGYQVSGSDGKLYEPMKSVLANAKIQLLEGFVPENLKQVEPDLVIIGNVIRKDNPESSAWIQKGTPFCSFPEAVRRFVIEDRVSVVCAGTHGKTTTSSWIAFLLRELGLNPSYLIGGVPLDLPSGCLITDGKVFVGEGDEYDSAFFDKGPKFLHYAPTFGIIANIEFDHADIYRDLDHVKQSFEKFVAILPGDGLLVARYDDPVALEVAQGALCPVQTFGTGQGAMWRLGNVKESTDGFHFEVIYKNKACGEFQTPLFGEHNLLNLLSGIIVAVNLGEKIDRIRPIVAKFRGARRRQEILASKPITLVDDFAHHPTEVAATISAVKRRFPNSKLWALFEPRSATARRNVHQADYVKAFDSADEILLSVPFKSEALNAEVRLSTESLVNELSQRGKKARQFPSSSSILDVLKNEAKPGDTLLVMSNGEFDKIQSKILSLFA